MRHYYVIEFCPTPANIKVDYAPRHISLLEEKTLFALESFINRLYP